MSGAGSGYAGYEVWFSFAPDEPVSDPATADWIGREHELRLANSWYLGPEFVKKYGLEAGRTIRAVLDVQKAGPCTPFVFRFPTADTTDYFERGRQERALLGKATPGRHVTRASYFACLSRPP